MSDSLFRISLKAYIENDKGEVLVVKEAGRQWWDLPGGGMDYEEDFETALKRELEEEVGYTGKFTYEVVGAENPHLLLRQIWQVRIVFKVTPETFDFKPGVDGDEIQFVDPETFKDSESGSERLACYYSKKLKGDMSYEPNFPLKETEKGW
jgi:8-oxo-dGTP pyrophosphatase MutT (NUDIX family)